MSKLLKRNEFYVSALILLLILVIELRSGQFFTSNNIVDLLRASIVLGIFSMGVMVEIIAKSIDVSFPAIAMITMYTVTELSTTAGYTGPVWLLFLLAAVMGALLGTVNGILASWLKIPTLIITMGTNFILMGVMQGVLKSRVIARMAEPLQNLSNTYLFTATNKETGLTSPMPILFLLFIAIIVFVGIMMNYTNLGRGIYAFGADPVAAKRAGFNITFIQIFVFTFMGMLAGLGGLTSTVLIGACQPTALIGYEMDAIAAAVLGGAMLSGGYGTVSGTLLGVFLLTIVKNSLILVGIPTFWTQFMIGVAIILGIGISSYQALRDSGVLHKSAMKSKSKDGGEEVSK